MNPFESLRIAFSSILSNKMRSSLTMLGVVIGVTAVILLVSIGQGVSGSISGQIKDLGSNLVFVMPGAAGAESGGGHGGTVNRLRYEHYQELRRAIPWIEHATPWVEGSGRVTFRQNKENTLVFATVPDYTKVRKFQVVKGRFFNEAQINSLRKVCVIGWTISDKLFSGRNSLGEKIIINGQKFTVIGLLEKKGRFMGMDQDNTVIIPITSAKRLFGSDNISGIMVESPSSSDVERLEKRITAVLDKRLQSTDFHVQTQGEILGMMNTILGTLTLMLGGIAAISLVVGGIGIMNIMLVSVTERTREIGIRKAVGAKRRNVLVQFLIEAVALSTIGGVVGIALGAGGSTAINRFLPSQITIWSVLVAFVFSALVGIVSGVYPAYKAAKMDPIDALRYE